MLKVLYTETGDTGLGGSYHSLKNLVELISDQVECHILYSNEPRVYPEGENIYIYRGFDPITSKTFFRGFLNKIYYKLISIFPSRKSFVDKALRSNFLNMIDKIVSENKIDIIHVNNQPFRDDFILSDNQKRSIGLVSHIRTENINGLAISHKPGLDIRYICVSQSVERLWSNLLCFKHSIVLNNFLADDIRKNSKKIKYSYCYLGRLVEGKGIFELLEAHLDVLKFFSDAKLYLIGDGPLIDEIKIKIARLEIPAHSISVVGFVENPQDYLSEIEIIILPSKKEGFGRVLIEGMAQGCVAIGTRTGGIKDIIFDEENGVFLETVSSLEIRERLVSLFKNPDLITRYRNRSYELIKERFSSKQYKKKLISLYREVI